jgi:hypothetical protein
MTELKPSRMVELLGYLQAARPSVFGADSHQFKLNPALTETRVIAFERHHSISLPSDYRVSVTGVGDGGAGPFYGVFPLGMVDDNFDLRQWHADDGLIGDPSKPFLLREEWNDTSTMPSPDLADKVQAEYDRRTEECEKTYWLSDLLNGPIPICHEGCALRIWLVVAGEIAGQLWEDRRSEGRGIRPVRLADGSPATFGAWYGEWLQQCLAAAESASSDRNAT